MYHIISHDDLDGYASAWIVKNFLIDNEDVQEDQIIITNTGYNQDPNLKKIKHLDEVYITDYSLKPKVMNELLQITQNVIWLDHHKSALEYIPEYSLKVKGKQIIGMSATALTYLWFYAPKEILDKSVSEMENYLNKNARRWINLVDAWDCWKLESKYRKQAELLNIYLSEQLSLEMIEKLAINDEEYLDDLLLKGSIYEEYKRLCDKNHIKYSSYEINILVNNKKYKALMVNGGSFSSLAFGDNIDKYDICICYLNSGDNIKVSLYSNKDYIDCSKLCKSFGGGGHKSAAGFNIPFPSEESLNLFKKDATWLFNIKDWEEENGN